MYARHTQKKCRHIICGQEESWTLPWSRAIQNRKSSEIPNDTAFVLSHDFSEDDFYQKKQLPIIKVQMQTHTHFLVKQFLGFHTKKRELWNNSSEHALLALTVCGINISIKSVYRNIFIPSLLISSPPPPLFHI